MAYNDCANCAALENCKTYCQRRAGKNVLDFLETIDALDTDIGDLKSDRSFGSLFVNGIQVDDGYGSFSTLLTKSLDTKKSLTEKLGKFAGDSPYAILKLYAQYAGYSDAECKETVERLRRFNSVHAVPMTFKPGTEIECTHPGFDRKGHTIESKIKSIKVCLDNETGELTGVIIAPASNTEDGNSYVKLKLSDYGTTWNIPSIERSLRASELDRKLIKVNDVGLIAPIEATHKDCTICLDGQNLYLKKPECAYVIGKWGYSGISVDKDVDTEVTSSKAFKYILGHQKYVEKHRRFILPYGFTPSNKIEL